MKWCYTTETKMLFTASKNPRDWVPQSKGGAKEKHIHPERHKHFCMDS